MELRDYANICAIFISIITIIMNIVNNNKINKIKK